MCPSCLQLCALPIFFNYVPFLSSSTMCPSYLLQLCALPVFNYVPFLSSSTMCPSYLLQLCALPIFFNYVPFLSSSTMCPSYLLQLIHMLLSNYNSRFSIMWPNSGKDWGRAITYKHVTQREAVQHMRAYRWARYLTSYTL